MTCVHLRELFQICDKHDLKLSSADVIHIVCPQCGLQETCPSALTAELERREGIETGSPNEPISAPPRKAESEQ
jgi:hypothetical protein